MTQNPNTVAPPSNSTPAPRPQSRRGHRVDSLTVLYDQNCPVCRTAHRWVERQNKLVPVGFIPAGSDMARHHFPDLDIAATMKDVTAIDNTGAVYRGDQAWLIVLWCVRRTRRLATDLALDPRRWAFHNVVNATELMRKLSRTDDVGPTAAALPGPSYPSPSCPSPSYPAQPYPSPSYPSPPYPYQQNLQARYWQQPYPFQQQQRHQPARYASFPAPTQVVGTNPTTTAETQQSAARLGADCEGCHE